MTTHESHVSVADLAAAGVAVNHVEAVTIVRDVLLRASRGELPGVPSAHVIRLTSSGVVSVEGPIAADDRAVPRAAHLLDALLPGFDAPVELRVPGALRLVLARALGTLDLPPYASLEAFADALTRFGSPDPQTTVRELVARRPVSADADAARTDDHVALVGSEAPDEDVAISEHAAGGRPAAPVRLEPRETALTISDIRRARRATGLTLSQISERSRISTRLLVELEWGYMRNWPASHVGRTQLVRYARAAGLDDHLVVRTVWPLLEESVRERQNAIPLDISIVPIARDEDEDEDEGGEMQSTAMAPFVYTAPARQHWGRKRYLAALAIPALLAIGIVPALWERSTRPHASEAARSAEGVSPSVIATLSRSAKTPPPVPASAAAAPAPSVPAGATPAPERASLPPAQGPATTAAVRPGSSAPGSAASARGADHTEPAVRPANATLVGSPVRGIADGPAYSPSFATVGSAMFYQAESGGTSALMRADTDSRGAILRITSVVDDRAQNFHARQSPDGTLIAFDSDRDGERAVYIADADGQHVKRMSGEGFAAIPSWSPDGRTIAFVRAEAERPKVWNLWTADVSSGRARRITSYKVGAPWGGSWFPDGRRIAYSHETNLVVLDLETGRERVYDAPVRGRLVRTPAVSPDGKRVMFQVHRDGAWLLELADGSMRKVLSDPSAEEYTWAPDGQRVAYHSRREGSWGVWVMAPR